jgi:hypothetical protein
MPPSTVSPPFDQFLATAEAVAKGPPEVDSRWLVRRSMRWRLSSKTVSPSTVSTQAPSSLGARCQTTWRLLEILHDPDGVSATYQIAAENLQRRETDQGTPTKSVGAY